MNKSPTFLVVMFVALALAFSALIAERSAVAQGSSIAISPASQAEVAAYLKEVKNTRQGAFAVSLDGLDTFYTWCEDLMCNVNNYSNIAMRGCQGLSGAQCVVLYFRNEQRLAITVLSGAGAGRHGKQKQYRYDFD